MPRARVLVVDDKPNMLRLLSRILGRSYDVTTANGGREAFVLLAENEFDLVVTDVRMPDVGGMEVLERTRELLPYAQVVMMTAYGEISQAVEAMRRGAIDYITKPFEPEVIEVIAEKALERRSLLLQAETLREEVEEKYSFGAIIGKSAAMRKAFDLLRKAADSDVTVLIQGESGAGKELFAKAVHYASARARGRFVPVNCAAIPHGLLESELFGHAKGAFTGAVKAKDGLFRDADKGTIFLDEISSLHPDLQVKLTRAIQEREVRPVGESRAVKTDARIIAATNRDLTEQMQAGQFREDLYFRLSVFPIRTPPLRERLEDIPLLVAHFVRLFAERENKAIEGLEPDALSALMDYDWPGNVRELENLIERAALLEDGPRISRAAIVSGLSHPLQAAAAGALLELPYRDAMDLAGRQAGRRYLAAMLRRSHGNVTLSARSAGMERESFHRLIKKAGLNAADFRNDRSAE